MSLTPRTPRCPTCKGEVAARENPTYPFCSSRCQLVDLGRWLNEEYHLTAPLTERDASTIEEVIAAREREEGEQG